MQCQPKVESRPQSILIRLYLETYRADHLERLESAAKSIVTKNSEELERHFRDRLQQSELLAVVQPSYQAATDVNPFLSLPIDFRDIPGEEQDIDVMFLHGNHEGCPYAVIPNGSAFRGHPALPDIVPHPAGAPPAKYAWADPSHGRLEIASIVTENYPSEPDDFPNQVFNAPFAYLSAEHAISVSSAKTVKITVAIRVSAFFVATGIAGALLSALLVANAYPSGGSLQAYYPLEGIFDTDLVGKWAVRTLDNELFFITGNLNVVPGDFLIMSLCAESYVFKSTLAFGIALVDMEGLTAPPGQLTSHKYGALRLPRFVISDPDCPLMYLPSPWGLKI